MFKMVTKLNLYEWMARFPSNPVNLSAHRARQWRREEMDVRFVSYEVLFSHINCIYLESCNPGAETGLNDEYL